MHPSAHPRRIAAAMALAALLAGCSASSGASPTQSPGTAEVTVTAPATSTTTTTAVSPTPARPASVAAPTASAKGPVKAAELRTIAVPALGFRQSVSPLSTTAMGDAIDPPLAEPGKPSGPIRVSDKGVMPSSDADDTVYVGCHTSATHGPDQYPCDVLIRRVQKGQSIVATTDAGTLTYTVTNTRSIPYGDFAGDDETWRVQAKRLVFVMCDVLNGSPTHANYVVYADLAS